MICRNSHLGRLQSDIDQRWVLLHNHKVNLSWHVSVSEHFHFVHARQQDAPVLSVFGRHEANVAALDLHRDPFQGDSIDVHHKALNTTMRLSQELDQGQLVVVPVFLQLMGWWVLAAGHLQRNLVTAVPYVVVVLHSTGQRIPVSAVGYSIFKGRRSTFASLGMSE